MIDRTNCRTDAKSVIASPRAVVGADRGTVRLVATQMVHVGRIRVNPHCLHSPARGGAREYRTGRRATDAVGALVVLEYVQVRR